VILCRKLSESSSSYKIMLQKGQTTCREQKKENQGGIGREVAFKITNPLTGNLHCNKEPGGLQIGCTSTKFHELSFCVRDDQCATYRLQRFVEIRVCFPVLHDLFISRYIFLIVWGMGGIMKRSAGRYFQ
jgi:hypothetical protein